MLQRCALQPYAPNTAGYVLAVPNEAFDNVVVSFGSDPPNLDRDQCARLAERACDLARLLEVHRPGEVVDVPDALAYAERHNPKLDSPERRAFLCDMIRRERARFEAQQRLPAEVEAAADLVVDLSGL